MTTNKVENGHDLAFNGVFIPDLLLRTHRDNPELFDRICSIYCDGVDDEKRKLFNDVVYMPVTTRTPIMLEAVEKFFAAQRDFVKQLKIDQELKDQVECLIVLKQLES